MKLLALAASAAIFAFPVAAQQGCGPKDRIVASLTGQHGEARVGMGTRAFVHGRAIMEIWANPETGTWTETITYSNGVMCLTASGRDWVALNEEPPTPEAAPGKDM